MTITADKTKEAITLHGLGFLQILQPDNVRVHIWHPDLPRRKCFRDSAIHNHRFGFHSCIIMGTQINHRMLVHKDSGRASEVLNSLYIAYLHEGPRTRFGNRPWTKDMLVTATPDRIDTVEVAGSYNMMPYDFHWTEPGGNGIVVTRMTKMEEGKRGAHSLCKVGVDPDVDFDRKQWSDRALWALVGDVLGHVSRDRLKESAELEAANR